MKFGFRKPGIKKSISAKTTGKAKKAMIKAINPTYSQNGIGLLKNPKKAIYNKAYNKSTASLDDLFPHDHSSHTINIDGTNTSQTTVDFNISTNYNYVNVDKRSSKYANSTNTYTSPLGQECINYEKSISNRIDNYKNLTCPYCETRLVRELKRSSKCPSCKQKIHIAQSGLNLGLMYLTDDEDEKLSNLKDKFYTDRAINPNYK